MFSQFPHSKLESCLIQAFDTWGSSITDMLMPDSDFKYDVTIRQQSKVCSNCDPNKHRVSFMLVAMVPNRLALQLRRHRRFPDELQTPITNVADTPFETKTLVTLGYYERKAMTTASPPETSGLFVYAINLDDDDPILDQIYGLPTSSTPFEQQIRNYYASKEFVSAYDVLAMYASSLQIALPNATNFAKAGVLPSPTPFSLAENSLLFKDDGAASSLELFPLKEMIGTFIGDDDTGSSFDIEGALNLIVFAQEDVALPNVEPMEDIPPSGHDSDDHHLDDHLDEHSDDASVGEPEDPCPKRQRVEDIECPVDSPEEVERKQRNAHEAEWCGSYDPWLFWPNGVQLSTLQPTLKVYFDNAAFAFRQHREQLGAMRKRRANEYDISSLKREYDAIQQQVASTWMTTLQLFRSTLSAPDAPRFSAYMGFARNHHETGVILDCLFGFMRQQCGMDSYGSGAASLFDVFLCKHNQIERAFDRQYLRHREAAACAGALVAPLSVLPPSREQEKLLKWNEADLTTVERLAADWPESSAFMQNRTSLLKLRCVCRSLSEHDLLRTAMPRIELYVPYKRFYINTRRLEDALASDSHSPADAEIVKSMGRCLQTVQRQSQQRLAFASRCKDTSQTSAVVQTFLKKPHDTSINLQLSIRGGVLRQMQPYAELVAHLRFRYEAACGERVIKPLYLYNEFLYLVVQLEMEMFSTDANDQARLQFVQPTHDFFKKQNQRMAQNSHVLLSELLTNTMRSNAKLRGPTVDPTDKYLPSPLKNGGKVKMCDKGGSTRLWPLHFEFSADDINRQTTFFKKQAEQAQPAPTGRLRLVTKVMAYTSLSSWRSSDDEPEVFGFVSPEVAARQRLDADLLKQEHVDVCVQLSQNCALCIQEEPFEMATKTRLKKFDEVCGRLNMKVQG